MGAIDPIPCPSCGGPMEILPGRDSLYGAPGSYVVSRCVSPRCGTRSERQEAR